MKNCLAAKAASPDEVTRRYGADVAAGWRPPGRNWFYPGYAYRNVMAARSSATSSTASAALRKI
ncbi:MAG: hypothetical protein KGH91_00935, partial [Rhodospirillales bacterium]|nr:hypothetical protein [Rhodospirillales bacterium]